MSPPLLLVFQYSIIHMPKRISCYLPKALCRQHVGMSFCKDRMHAVLTHPSMTCRGKYGHQEDFLQETVKAIEHI